MTERTPKDTPKDTPKETSLELEHALDGDRDAALDMWRTVAAYPMAPDSIVWSQEVAKRILDAVPQKDARLRPVEIQRAIGLSGHADKHRRLRDFIDVTRSFSDLNRKGPPARGDDTKRLIAGIRNRARLDLAEQDPEQRYFCDYDDEYLKQLADPGYENEQGKITGLGEHALEKLISIQRSKPKK